MQIQFYHPKNIDSSESISSHTCLLVLKAKIILYDGHSNAVLKDAVRQSSHTDHRRPPQTTAGLTKDKVSNAWVLTPTIAPPLLKDMLLNSKISKITPSYRVIQADLQD